MEIKRETVQAVQDNKGFFFRFLDAVVLILFMTDTRLQPLLINNTVYQKLFKDSTFCFYFGRNLQLNLSSTA